MELKKINYYAGRVAAILGVAVTIIGGLIPIIANTDWTSTLGILTAITGADAVILKFMHGAQRHEDRIAFSDDEAPPAE